MRDVEPDIDSRVILETDHRWLEAFNRADVETLTAIYDPDVVVMPPGEPSLEGREAVRAWLEAFFKGHTARQTLVHDEIVVAGAWAFLRGRFDLTVAPRDGGEPSHQHGKHLVIWRRDPRGRWLAARDIWNLEA
jgi:uncharacterized protein (TIGR02246 family)